MQPVSAMPSSYPQHASGYHQNQAAFLSSPNNQASTVVQPEQFSAASTQQRKLGRRVIVLGGASAVAAATIAGGAFLLPRFLSKPASPTPKPAAKVIPGPQKLISGIPLLALTGHSNYITNVTWNPNGRYLASAGQDTRVMLWDIESYLKQKSGGFQTVSTPLRTWKFAKEIAENHLGWSHDGQTLGVTDLITTKIHLLDAFGKSDSPQEYTDTGMADPLSAPQYDYLAWSPVDNTFVASVSFKNSLTLWQQNKTTTPAKTLNYNQPEKDIPAGIEHVQWSSNGAFIAGTPANFGIVVWDVKTGKVVQEISLPDRAKQHSTFLERSDLKYSPNDPYKLATTDIDIVTVYNTQNKNLLFSLGTDDKDALTLPPNDTIGWVPQVGGISWSPNGRYIAGSYGRSNKIYIWDMQDKHPNKMKDSIQLQSLLFGKNNGHSATILDLAWSPDGRYIATASFDKTIIIWKVDAV
jgi:WD40 repeat protein